MSTISPVLDAPRLQGQASSWRKSVPCMAFINTSPTQHEARTCSTWSSSLAVQACKLAAPQALLQHNGLGNAHVTQGRYLLLQSHWPYPSWKAQIHSLKSALHCPVRPAEVDPECPESVKAKHRAWKQWRTHNNNNSHAPYTRSCTTAKNCHLQAKSSYQSRLRGRLTSGNLQAKQWW